MPHKELAYTRADAFIKLENFILPWTVELLRLQEQWEHVGLKNPQHRKTGQPVLTGPVR